MKHSLNYGRKCYFRMNVVKNGGDEVFFDEIDFFSYCSKYGEY